MICHTAQVRMENRKWYFVIQAFCDTYIYNIYIQVCTNTHTYKNCTYTYPTTILERPNFGRADGSGSQESFQRFLKRQFLISDRRVYLKALNEHSSLVTSLHYRNIK